MKKILIIISVLLLSGCVSNTGETAPNLSSAYKDYFDIGVAVTSTNINSLVDEDLIDEFDTFTAEYEMKWDQIQTSADSFNFDKCDDIINFANEHNKTVRGHTLVWRTNVPSFIYDIAYSSKSNTEKMDEVLEFITTYYTTIYERYGNTINVFDVANEVIEDYNDYMYRYDNIYFEMFDYNESLFEEFIAKVFIMVKEVSPNVKRYYNDYFLLTDQVKRNKVIKFINNINGLGADVEGVGMQSHITTSITKEQVDNALLDFRANDLMVSFTELDISIYEADSIAPTLPVNYSLINYYDYEDKITRAYNHIFSAARENKDIVENITFWGIYDSDSWLVKDFYNYRTDFPLLFDGNYKKKKAYYIVRDFEIYNGGNL